MRICYHFKVTTLTNAGCASKRARYEKKKKKKYNACSFKICPIEVGKNGQVNRRYAN